jgi:hypothetical protein
VGAKESEVETGNRRNERERGGVEDARERTEEYSLQIG